MEYTSIQENQKPINSDVFSVLGRLPSGLLVLTTRKGELETGMLVSWVMQAGFKPPSITVAILQQRFVGEWLSQGCRFALNLLEDGQISLLRQFSRGVAPQRDPFSALNIERTSSGIAILKEALGFIECSPVRYMDSGDHRIFLATVGGGRLAAERQPMVHVRRSGVHY